MSKTRTVPEGYRVRYTHFRHGVKEHNVGFGARRTPWTDEPLYGTAHEISEAGGRILPHGGETFATIFDAEGEPILTSSAICRPDEGFVKSFGRHVALNRALKALEEAE